MIQRMHNDLREITISLAGGRDGQGSSKGSGRLLIGTSEASERLGMTPQTLRKLARSGALPVVRIPGTTHLHFRTDTLERLVEEYELAPLTSSGGVR